MSDSYQPIFDAVRSRITNGDIGAAVTEAIRAMGLDWAFAQAVESIRGAASCYERPSVLFRPHLAVDGNQWCALYGENLQEGVAGFGPSPADAMAAFDAEWFRGVPNNLNQK